ncbi:MAG TPA: energy transducer TonB [Polyangia bacterium]|nr:energy transducer TonB [Polyangia bacterium]
MAASLLAAAALHGVVLAAGVFWGQRWAVEPAKTTEAIKVELREPVPPVPEAPAPKAEEAPRAAAAPASAAKHARRPRAPAEAPPTEAPTDADAPPLLAGISLEATTTSGNGPVMAVGSPGGSARGVRGTASHGPATAGTGAGNEVAATIGGHGRGFVLPRRRRPHEPPYPPTLKAQGVEGEVLVSVSIGDNGKVTNVRLVRPSAYAEFNEASRLAALSEDFEPATRDGMAVPYTITYTYRFRLETE